MPAPSFRRRKRLRRKEVAALVKKIDGVLGWAPFADDAIVDVAEGPDYDVLYVEGEILAIVVEGEPFPTIRGLLRGLPRRRYVTVDMGAVPHIYNGADVMAPGIVDVDPSIQEGDLVWVRDVKNLRPLAVGKALMSGETMVASDRGKAVRTVHHVGDGLWKLGET
jgi:PUA domain protein